MPTVMEVLTEIRDAANINAHALDLTATQAEAHFEAIRQWPDSGTKRVMMQDLANASAAYRQAEREANDLEETAQEAMQSMSDDPVPAPPEFPDNPTAGGVAQWSTRDW